MINDKERQKQIILDDINGVEKNRKSGRDHK